MLPAAVFSIIGYSILGNSEESKRFIGAAFLGAGLWWTLNSLNKRG